MTLSPLSSVRQSAPTIALPTPQAAPQVISLASHDVASFSMGLQTQVLQSQIEGLRQLIAKLIKESFSYFR